MNELLGKILVGRMSWGRFTLASVGFVVGLLTVLLSLQTYLKFRDALDPSEDFHEYLILSKDVSFGGALFGASASFTAAEIEEIAARPFVRKLGVFSASRFDVTASVGGEIGGDYGLVTEMFLEAVPVDFLDDPPDDWGWSQSAGTVPMILSRDFLNLYNFGYAISRGLPQLSAGTIQALPVEMTVSGPGGRRSFDARVVGFSHRIGSILVPEEFLDWANETVGRSDAKDPSKLIVHVDQRRNAEIQQYLAAQGVRVNPDRLNSGRAVMVLNIATSVVLLVGLFFVVLAVTIMVLNFAILVSDARAELELLIHLGYTTRILFVYLMRHLVYFVAVITVASAIGFAVCWQAIAGMLVERGLPASTGVEPWVLPLGLAFVVATVVITGYHTRRLIVRL